MASNSLITSRGSGVLPRAVRILAMILGVAPLAAVRAGLLPKGATQLAALSASLAGIILAAVEGRGGVRELLRRFLIWRVGIQWWAFALLFGIVPAVAGLYLFDLLGGPPVDWSRLSMFRFT
jgi:hypothetical protein